MSSIEALEPAFGAVEAEIAAFGGEGGHGEGAGDIAVEKKIDDLMVDDVVVGVPDTAAQGACGQLCQTLLGVEFFEGVRGPARVAGDVNFDVE